MTGAAASPAARVALTLIIGALGGAIFAYAGLPAAWLAGSMIAVTAAVMLGYPAAIYDPARIAVFIILGIQIGGSIDQEMLRRMASWPASVIILALTVIAVTWSGYEFFRRAYGWDRATSLFSSVPGALSLTLLLADDARADMPRVTIVQCIRLFFLVAVLPGIISTMDGVSTQTVIASRPSGEFQDAAILVAAGAAGGFIAERLKIPAGLIMGALAASAAVKTAGFVSGPLTNLLLFPAYVVLGTMIGSRFQSFDRRLVGRLLLAGISGFAVAMAVASAGAVAAHKASGIPLALALVAFAPGGLEAMTIMAFALNLDPAYVGAMQIARYAGISVLLPIAAKWLERAWGR
jgi:membrane AbrB-like protein